MSRLISAELLRLRSRAGVVGVLCGAVAVVLVLMVGLFITHEDDYAAAAAAFRAERAAGYAAARDSYRLTTANVGADQLDPRAREVTEAEYVDGMEFFGGRTAVPSRRFEAATDLVEATRLTAWVIALGAFIAGASYAGADWASRTVQGLLTWESRRSRVLAAKLCVIGLASAVTLLAAQMVTHAMGLLTGVLRGTVAGLGAAWWAAEAGSVMRGAVLAVIAGGLGFGLAFAARSTGFALGLAFIQVGVIETFILGARPRWTPYTLRGAADGLLSNGTAVEYLDRAGQASTMTVTLLTAALVLALYVGGVLSIAAGTFLRRDVA